MKKKLLFVLLILVSLIWTIPCFASTKTYNRDELDNYGVRKKWQITSSNRSNVLATPAVDASEKIYDFSELLTDTEEMELKRRIDEFIQESQMDMVIVTTSFYYDDDSLNDTYASDFYDYNDFGIDFDHYSGVLFLRNSNLEDPYFDIYTFGNAQLYFDFSRLDSLLDLVYDDIHEGEYYSGFSTFVSEMKRYYENGIPSSRSNYYIDDDGYLRKTPMDSTTYTLMCVGISLGVAFVITLIVMLILVKKNKMVFKARTAEGYLKRDSINISNRQDVFVTSHTHQYTVSSDSGGSGSSSHSGSSGGGFSSGGGRHG